MKKETLNKIIDTINVLVAPVCAIVAIWWSTDISIYVAGAAGIANSICEYLKLFCKE